MFNRRPMLRFLLSCAAMGLPLVVLAAVFGQPVTAFAIIALHLTPLIAAFRSGAEWRQNDAARPFPHVIGPAAGRAGLMTLLAGLTLALAFIAVLIFLMAVSAQPEETRGYVGLALIAAFFSPPVYVIYAGYALFVFVSCWLGLLTGYAHANRRLGSQPTGKT